MYTKVLSTLFCKLENMMALFWCSEISNQEMFFSRGVLVKEFDWLQHPQVIHRLLWKDGSQHGPSKPNLDYIT
jgi:outer membrane protease